MFSYDAGIDLSGVTAKLTRLGYHADGSTLTGPTEQLSDEHIWMSVLRVVAVDPGRHLLFASADAAELRSVFAVPPHPLGRTESVAPLLAQVAARQNGTATAVIAVGSEACVPVTALVKKATPVEIAAVRRLFPGTFTPPEAEMTAIAGPTYTTALDVSTFPDHRAGQANRAARSAASEAIGGMIAGDASGFQATDGAVTGRVLGFDLTATRPQALQQRVSGGRLGVDLCP